jgi:hypothetical protein
VLFGGAAFLFRTQISHWLSKDLEAVKAGYQRELEAYKVSLIADSERAKATQQVKMAAALMVAEKRFAAINRLHKAVDGIAAKMMHTIEMDRGLGPDKFLVIFNQAQTELMAATAEGDIFLRENERELFMKLADATQRAILAKYPPESLSHGEIERKYYEVVFSLQRGAEAVVAAHIKRLAMMED